MNGTDNCATILSCQVTKNLHHICGCERIKTSCRFIEEDQTGVSDQFNTDGSTLALTTGYTLNEGTTDPRVGTLCQLQVMDELVDTCNFLGQSAWQLELGSKFETLPYGHRLEQDIILLDVGGQGRKVANLVLVLTIDHDGASLLKVLRNFTSREEIEQGGLASSGGADDCEELSWHDCAGDTPNNFLRLRECVLWFALAFWWHGLDDDVFPGDLAGVLDLLAHGVGIISESLWLNFLLVGVD